MLCTFSTLTLAGENKRSVPRLNLADHVSWPIIYQGKELAWPVHSPRPTSILPTCRRCPKRQIPVGRSWRCRRVTTAQYLLARLHALFFCNEATSACVCIMADDLACDMHFLGRGPEPSARDYHGLRPRVYLIVIDPIHHRYHGKKNRLCRL